MPKARNLLYGAGLAAVGLGFAVLPLYLGKRTGKNLTTQHDPLGGHQVMRGAYINSGSHDAGADPSWARDPAGGKGLVYVGRPTHDIDAETARRFKEEREQQKAALRAQVEAPAPADRRE